MELDDVDRRILAELRRDGRASMTAVADAVHISRANAYARVNRLVDGGVIAGFTVRVDAVRAGQHASAYVSLSTEQESWQDVRDELARIPEIEHIALIGGDADVLLLVRARDTSHLRRIVLEQLQAIPAVRSTRTSIIFEDFEPLPGAPGHLVESGEQSG